MVQPHPEQVGSFSSQLLRQLSIPWMSLDWPFAYSDHHQSSKGSGRGISCYLLRDSFNWGCIFHKQTLYCGPFCRPHLFTEIGIAVTWRGTGQKRLDFHPPPNNVILRILNVSKWFACRRLMSFICAMGWRWGKPPCRTLWSWMVWQMPSTTTTWV